LICAVGVSERVLEWKVTNGDVTVGVEIPIKKGGIQSTEHSVRD